MRYDRLRVSSTGTQPKSSPPSSPEPPDSSPTGSAPPVTAAVRVRPAGTHACNRRARGPDSASVSGTPEHPAEFRVEPQFVHRTLAAQALGADSAAPLDQVADRITAEIVALQVPDLRVAAVKGDLGLMQGTVVTVRAGFYFKRHGEGARTRIRFSDKIKVDGGAVLQVEGELDPARYESNSAWTNLSGRQNAYMAGIATCVDVAEMRVELRPLLVGFPFYAPRGSGHPLFAPTRPEVFCRDIEEFGLSEVSMRTAVAGADLRRLFSMSEQSVKEAFGKLLGLSQVPADWGGEHSDLVAEVTLRGTAARAAFALKGPGGRPKPWTLYPSDMGKRGDQAVRLFAEPADIMVVQHCSLVAESVRHIMDALATTNQKRYSLIDGDNTVRILKAAGLLTC